MAQFILSHDIGTTGDKATLFKSDGRIIARSFSSYPTFYPHIGWAEQDPNDYWIAFCNATKEILEKSKVEPIEIAVVSFSGQMMAALPVDKQGNALRNSIIWADLRSEKEAKGILEKVGDDFVYLKTGHRLSPSYSASKIIWIKKNEPEIYNSTFKFIHAKDFIVSRLTGKIISDYSDASGMNLLDIKALKWSDDLVEIADIDKNKLPDLVESTTVVGKINSDASISCGLLEGTRVVIGGGDGPCATAGAGVYREGEAYIYLGTSTWIGLATKRPIIDEKKRTFTFCHFKKGLYMPAGTMQAGGGSYQWLKNIICGLENDLAKKTDVDVYDILNLKAEKVPCGSDGLIYLPYLMGERSPLWNPYARGCFIGLSMMHKKEHLIRAVLEGVAYNMKLITLAFKEQGIKTPILRIIGGGAKSRLWRSIFSDILETKVLKLNVIEEATSLGAAVAGGVGVGIFSSLEDAKGIVKIDEEVTPNCDNFDIYRYNFKIFEKSYRKLIDIFDMIAKAK